MAPLQLLAATIGFLALAERLPALRRRPSPLLRAHAATDLALFALSWVAVTAATQPLLTAALPDRSLALPLWAETALALVLLDLGNYVAHWLMHRYASLWRVHAVHHSSPVLDWLATFRSHPLEQLLRRALAPALLIAVGIAPPAAAIAGGIFVAWATLNHANLRVDLRLLEPILITPRLHHLHHVPAAADRNLGTLLNLWDRLTGRFVATTTPPDAALGNGERDYGQSLAALLRAPCIRTSSGRDRSA